ncbi:MAG: hypothetical protein ACOH2A_08070 [Sphingobacteriaceae bacterium]
MTQQEIFKKIDGILRELNDQSTYLQGEPDFLNDLELELFMANANFLTDHVEILRKLNNQLIKAAEKNQAQAFLIDHSQSGMVEIGEPETPTKPIEFDMTRKEEQPLEKKSFSFEHFEKEKPVTAPAENTFIDPQPVNTTNAPVIESLEEPVIIRHELTLDELEDAYEEDEESLEGEEYVVPHTYTEEIVEERYPEIPKPKFEKFVPVNEEPVIIPAKEPFKPETIAISTQVKIEETRDEQKVVTINQLIFAQKSTQTSAAKDVQRIDDLKSAITLNDKLLFIRDLFNNYSLAYSEAVDLLNRFQSLEEADHFLRSNYFEKNNWSAKQTTVDKFYEFLQRRFA